ncbi:hypothetical protein FRC08_004431 [Ceratobasidium sp. 394]|nr:hypothetical protein FRC08_004431 [Ceratobasidium sp. 394]
MSNRIVPQVYRAIIDEVMANIKGEFEEFGVEEDVLAQLQNVSLNENVLLVNSYFARNGRQKSSRRMSPSLNLLRQPRLRVGILLFTPRIHTRLLPRRNTICTRIHILTPTHLMRRTLPCFNTRTSHILRPRDTRTRTHRKDTNSHRSSLHRLRLNLRPHRVPG